MEVTELMIGDWVQVPSELNRYKVVRTTLDMDEAVLYRPVPLTHEIIKSNGFELFEVGDSGLGTPRKNINRYEEWICNTKWRDVIVWYDRLTKDWCLHGINSVKVKHVHELQHAMRLLHIDLVITL